MASPTAFGALLREHIQTAGLTDQAYAERVGLSQPTLSQIINGVRSMPEDRAQTFADALGLTEGERERFLVEAWLDKSPAELGEWVRAKMGWDHRTRKP